MLALASPRFIPKLNLLTPPQPGALPSAALAREHCLPTRGLSLRLPTVAMGGRAAGGGKKGGGFRNPHNLPVKDCVVCGRPFTWRKKWEKCWDEVLTCSNRCKSERKGGQKSSAGRVAAGMVAGAGAAARKSRGDRSESSESEEESGSETQSQCCNNDSVDGTLESADNLDKGMLLETQDNMSGQRDKLLEEIAAEPLSNVADTDLTSGSSDKEDSAPQQTERQRRKAQKKAEKARRKAQRARSPEAVAEKRKPCDICQRPVDLLVRCTCDPSRTWKMLCGKCWKEASGGVPDGDADHPYYRYGGLWKNRAAKVTTPSFSGKQRSDEGDVLPASEGINTEVQ
mmetsp:Transcript_44623/g.105806  ORF Transcript_44623/g.105806 Transcript_44623/m.105806 type:complete len:342 (+) Transcript_44623:98-1123(+)